MPTYIMPRLQGMKVGTGSFFVGRMSNWLRPKHAAADLIECVRFAKDSPLEEAGFEPSVPPVKETAVERGGSAANRRRLAKMTPSGLSVRYLPSATVETLS